MKTAPFLLRRKGTWYTCTCPSEQIVCLSVLLSVCLLSGPPILQDIHLVTLKISHA